jgi:hypothetical protein
VEALNDSKANLADVVLTVDLEALLAAHSTQLDGHLASQKEEIMRVRRAMGWSFPLDMFHGAHADSTLVWWPHQASCWSGSACALSHAAGMPPCATYSCTAPPAYHSRPHTAGCPLAHLCTQLHLVLALLPVLRWFP